MPIVMLTRSRRKQGLKLQDQNRKEWHQCTKLEFLLHAEMQKIWKAHMKTLDIWTYRLRTKYPTRGGKLPLLYKVTGNSRVTRYQVTDNSCVARYQVTGNFWVTRYSVTRNCWVTRYQITGNVTGNSFSIFFHQTSQKSVFRDTNYFKIKETYQI
jgi:hypothetical protein